MPAGNFPAYGFNAGEVSKIALARVDLAKMRLAAQCQVNWMPWAIGAMMLRPGMIYVDEILDDAACKLLPFVYSKTDTAQLELTANVMRVRIDDTLLARVAVATTMGDPTFTGSGAWDTSDTTDGCTATVTGGVATLTPTAVGGLARIKQTLTIASGDRGNEHGLRVAVANGPVTIRIGSADGLADYLAQTAIDSGTHSLAFTPTAASSYIQIDATSYSSSNGTGASNVGQRPVSLTGVDIESAGVVEIATPWGSGDLANLRIEQSGDIIFVACYGIQQHKIERRGARPGARGWSVVLYRSGDGPFQDAPAINANFRPSDYSGITALTSDTPYFAPGHVGALFRLFSPRQVNLTTLGADGAFTEPIRISGVGNDRAFSIVISGTWSGTLTLQRSLVGPLSGFTVTDSMTSNGFTDANDSAFLNNVEAWYRVGFLNAGDYTSGAAVVSFAGTGGVQPSGSTGGAVEGGGKWATCRVTAYVSPLQVDIEVLDPFSTLTQTVNWQEQSWSDNNGWPTTVRFHEGRLGWFGPEPIPIALSVANDYVSYAQEDNVGASLGDRGAILEDFGAGPTDFISWAFSGLNLVFGREMEISSARSSSFGTPLTPTGVGVHKRSIQGAARLAALDADARAIYVHQSGRRVYEVYFDPRETDYSVRDLTRLNVDIGKPGFVDLAMVAQPDRQAMLVRSEGQCAVQLHDVDDDVEAWWRVMTLGAIENVCVMPSASGIEDQVYFVVRRVVDGSTKRFLEKLAPRDNCTGGLLNEQLDCALIYSGSAVSTLQIAWLPSTAISVWADGAFIGTTTTDGSGNFTMPDSASHADVVAGLAGLVVTGSTNNPLASNVAPTHVFGSGAQGTLTVGAAYNGCPAEVFADIGGTGRPLQHIGALTVSGGVVTLPKGQVASTIVGCLGFVAPFLSAKLAYAAQGPTALLQKKKIDALGVILYDSAAQALQLGQSFDNLDPLPLVEADATTPAGTVWSEYDGDMRTVPGTWDTDARLCLLAQAPNPCTVGGVVAAVQTNEFGRFGLG